MFDKELFDSIDTSKITPVTFNFVEMTEVEITKLRKQGISDEEICRIANENK